MNKPIRKEELLFFLRQVDGDFPIPLSLKQDLDAYAEKLLAHGTLCARRSGDDGCILALAAGYTDHAVDDLGYLSIVATWKEARGRGYASRLVTQFLDIARARGLRGVHLYAVASNEPAVHMYRKLGFTDYHPQNEPRPDDLHLIYYFMR